MKEIWFSVPNSELKDTPILYYQRHLIDSINYCHVNCHKKCSVIDILSNVPTSPSCTVSATGGSCARQWLDISIGRQLTKFLIVQVCIRHILLSVSLLSLFTVGGCFTMPAYSVLGGQKYPLWKLGTLIKPRKRTFQNHLGNFGPRDGARNDKQAYDGFIMRGRRLAFLTQLKLRCG